MPLFSVQVLDNLALSAGHGAGFYDEYETKEAFTDKEYLYDGAVYAILWNEKLYIKKVYLEKDGFRLVSINKDYPDKFAPAEVEPRIVGKIVGNFMPIEQ